jgi:NTE family protein
MSEVKNDKIGLALGGGAVLGAAHVGVVKALEELAIPIEYVSGTSIGSLVAALYAFGIKGNEMERIAMDLKWLDISGLTLSNYGLLSNKKMERFIMEHLGDVRFEDSEIPLAIIATNLTKGEKVMLNEGRVADAIMASCCIPGVFVPVEIDGNLLVDGGIMENVPIPSLKEIGAKFTIGVDLNAEHSLVKPNNIVEVIINTIHITLRNVTKSQAEKADLLITPDLSEFNYYQTDQVAELIKKGYEESKKVLKDFDVSAD